MYIRVYCNEEKTSMQYTFFNVRFFDFWVERGLGGLSPYEQFLQVSTCGKSVKKLSMDVHRQCLLFRHAYIRKQCLLLRPVSWHRQCLLFLSRLLDKNSYHDFWVITTFRKKADKINIFRQKSRDNFSEKQSILWLCNTIALLKKVGITFFLKYIKSPFFVTKP